MIGAGVLRSQNQRFRALSLVTVFRLASEHSGEFSGSINIVPNASYRLTKLISGNHNTFLHNVRTAN
jgi:hypothetical protein